MIDLNVSLKVEAKSNNWNSLKLFFELFLKILNCCELDFQKVMLSCEEIFVNICSYAYKKKNGEIFIEISFENGKLKIVFSDKGIEFDPTKFKSKNLNSRLKNKNVGGLGILLVKENMDKLKYERKNGRNILTIIKKLGSD